jgi:hypothetical protein
MLFIIYLKEMMYQQFHCILLGYETSALCYLNLEVSSEIPGSPSQIIFVQQVTEDWWNRSPLRLNV